MTHPPDITGRDEAPLESARSELAERTGGEVLVAAFDGTDPGAVSRGVAQVEDQPIDVQPSL